MQVTSLLPSFTASGLEHVTSTTVPGSTGNCVDVFIVLVHSVFSPVQLCGAEEAIQKFCYVNCKAADVKFIQR